MVLAAPGTVVGENTLPQDTGQRQHLAHHSLPSLRLPRYVLVCLPSKIKGGTAEWAVCWLPGLGSIQVCLDEKHSDLNLPKLCFSLPLLPGCAALFGQPADLSRSPVPCPVSSHSISLSGVFRGGFHNTFPVNLSLFLLQTDHKVEAGVQVSLWECVAVRKVCTLAQ